MRISDWSSDVCSSDLANVLSADLPEGKRKLLDVAMALALRPKLLIMDEPTSGVASEDEHGLMQTVMNALKERKVTSWFVEHDVDIVEQYATRIARKSVVSGQRVSGRVDIGGPRMNKKKK